MNITSQNRAMLDFGSRGFMVAALSTLTLGLFRRGRIIHAATYFGDAAGKRLPVRDIATIVQYDTIAARSSHGARPTTVARHCAVSKRALSARCLSADTWHRRTWVKLECGPMPSVMVALPNIGGALCSTPQSLADARLLIQCRAVTLPSRKTR